MKRKLIALILIFMLVGTLTACSVEPSPKIKEGRFNFSITYEQWGEEKTVSGVFVCKYAGRNFTLEGGKFTREWEGHVEGVEHAEEVYTAAVLIYETDDGGEIYLDFGLFPARMMGEPDFADSVIEPALFFVYSNEDHTGAVFGDEGEIEELYGLKIIDYQYDPPIKNTFGS